MQNKDFKNYMSDNKAIIDELFNNNSVLLLRIEDVLNVLNFISDACDKGIELEEDEDEIFETGFLFFHEQIEYIKLYYQKYFNKDIKKLLEYESLINYYLYLIDLEETLKEKSYYNNSRKKIFDDIYTEIENIITNKDDFDPFITEKYDSLIESCLPNDKDLMTLSMIFSRIADEIV